ncbi:hypothetical protein GCM10009654_65920 [Streptomyces hebeiensis]|uniref:Uncharacterized protein n=1 Tax=Streptomyces hebeiensis TaxID=229486 RepID=A0ABP4FXA9_9ACTN
MRGFVALGEDVAADVQEVDARRGQVPHRRFEPVRDALSAVPGVDERERLGQFPGQAGKRGARWRDGLRLRGDRVHARRELP